MIGYVDAGIRAVRNEPLRRHQRLFLQRMEGYFLSRRPAREADAALLWRTLPQRGDKQHVLSHAEGVCARSMGRRSPVGIQVRAQSASTHHSYAAPQRCRRLSLIPPESRGCAERTAWPAPLSVAAVS